MFLLWWNLSSVHFSQICGNQEKCSNLVFEVRLSCHVTLTPPIPPPAHCPSRTSEPPLRATAVGDLSLNPQQEACSTPWPYAVPFSPALASDFSDCNHSLTSTFKRAQTSHGSCSPGKRIHAGRSPESGRGWISGELLMCPRSPALFYGGSQRGKKNKGCEGPRDRAENGK